MTTLSLVADLRCQLCRRSAELVLRESTDIALYDVSDPLLPPLVRRHLDQRQEPLLFEGVGDAVRITTGVRLRLRLARHVGLRHSLQLMEQITLSSSEPPDNGSVSYFSRRALLGRTGSFATALALIGVLPARAFASDDRLRSPLGSVLTPSDRSLCERFVSARGLTPRFGVIDWKTARYLLGHTTTAPIGVIAALGSGTEFFVGFSNRLESGFTEALVVDRDVTHGDITAFTPAGAVLFAAASDASGRLRLNQLAAVQPDVNGTCLKICLATVPVDCIPDCVASKYSCAICHAARAAACYANCR
jgi:hypothetical protein